MYFILCASVPYVVVGFICLFVVAVFVCVFFLCIRRVFVAVLVALFAFASWQMFVFNIITR